MKQKYYRLTKIKKLNADYNMLLGERSNGKSYAVKEDVLADAWKYDNRRFILLRRWELELKTQLAEQYFLDAPVTAITDGAATGISVYRGEIFFSCIDENTGKVKRIRKCGYTRALSQEQHYTSGAYDDVSNVVFEEFISRSYYLPQEPLHLMQFISTIARRRKINVYMIGNTISRLCPYFTEWQLVGIPKQKQGTIETYTYDTDQRDETTNEKITVTIAVEFCENSGNSSKMFFGVGTKMITSGTWQSREMPHLPKSYNIQNYEVLYTVFIRVANFSFRAELLSDNMDGTMLWYVQPTAGKEEKRKDDDRIVTDHIITMNNFTTLGLRPLSPQENYIFNLMRSGYVYYSDNLTGSDFAVCLKQLETVDTFAD